MVKVYVAGPYRAPTTWGIHQNIQEAKRWGLEIAKMGANPFVPHANTGYYDGELPEEFWLEADIEWLDFCDCLFVLPNSQSSEGTLGEIRYCHKQGIPVIYSLADLAKFITDKESEQLGDW